MEEKRETEKLHNLSKKQFIVEKKIIGVDMTSFLIASVFGIVAIAGLGFLLYSWELATYQIAVAILLGILIYAFSLYLMLKQKKLQKIHEVDVPTRNIIIEKPIYKIVEKPVEKIVERTTPVIKNMIKPVYIEKIRKMPQPKHYKFVASTTTKIYHSSHSRLARLIKNKNKFYSDSEAQLKAKGYKPSVHIKREKEEEQEKSARRTARGKKKKTAPKNIIKKKVISKKPAPKKQVENIANKGAGYSIESIR